MLGPHPLAATLRELKELKDPRQGGEKKMFIHNVFRKPDEAKIGPVHSRTSVRC